MPATTGPGAAPTRPASPIVYAPDRKAEQTDRAPRGFTGMLQVDGYAGYKALAERERRAPRLLLGACAAPLLRTRPGRPGADRHARRSRASPSSTGSRARSAAARAEERRAARQARSRPIVEALEPWLRDKLALVSQKSKLAEAIRYALSRWAGLSRFLDDGRIEIDSNVVERSIRPIALNRKNALFAGSDGGGRALGRHRLARRDRQAQRRRPAGLPRRRHHPHRRRPSAKPDRRPAALGLW